MSNFRTFNLPSFVALSVACGKPAKGEKIQYRTMAINISEWSDGQLAQWLAAGLSNIAGDRLASAAKDSGLAGVALINHKETLARDFFASLASDKAFPGRKIGEGKGKAPKAAPIPTLAACVALLESTFDAEDLGMDAEDFAAFIAKGANKLRAKRIQEAGRNPDTYDEEESAKLETANAESDDTDSDDTESNGEGE